MIYPKGEGPPDLVRESTEAFEASEASSFGASPPKTEASGFARGSEASEASEASSFGASPPKTEASGFARGSEASEARSFGASELRPLRLKQVALPGALKQVKLVASELRPLKLKQMALPGALQQVKLVASEFRASPPKNEASCFGASRFAP